MLNSQGCVKSKKLKLVSKRKTFVNSFTESDFEIELNEEKSF